VWPFAVQYSASTSCKTSGSSAFKGKEITNLLGFLDHLSPISRDAGRNLQTWELSDRGPGKTVHRVSTNLIKFKIQS
jgi:hypothetical protein